MSIVQILRGVPGCGKSTYAKSLKPDVTVSADDYFMRSGEYQFNPDELHDAHMSCLREFMKAVEGGGKVIVVDNTNIHAWEVAPYVAIGEAYGHTVSVITLNGGLSPEVCFEKCTHGVPLYTIQRMHDALRSEQLPNHWVCRSVAILQYKKESL